MAGPFSFLWLFPKRPSLLSSEGCGLGEKEQPPWGVATREGREGAAVGGQAVGPPPWASLRRPCGKCGRRERPQHRTGIDRWGGSCRAEEKQTPGLPGRQPCRHRPQPCCPSATSLPCMTCPTLVHQTLFCFFLFMQRSLCLALALEACPGESTSEGIPGGRPSAAGCPQKPAFLEHPCECRELTSQRRPSRLRGSLVPLLPEQPGGLGRVAARLPCARGYRGGR